MFAFRILATLLMLGYIPAVRSFIKALPKYRLHTMSMSIQELLICSPQMRQTPEVQEFQIKRPSCLIINKEETIFNTETFEALWTAHRGAVQLDSCELEPYFLGKKQYSVDETVKNWVKTITSRLEDVSYINIGAGGNLQHELNVAYSAVHRASYISRSLQRTLLKGAGAMSKEDKSPVTIADFVVQVLVIDILSRAFPKDVFIAEESSEVLREDETVRTGVLCVLGQVTGRDWTLDEIYTVIDRGTFQGQASRVWVLDPIDGTKGFMRGEHYCIALALLVGGVPALSVMGCPNLALHNVLTATNIAAVEPYASIPNTPHVVYSPEAGSVYFAVSGQGAYAKSLNMPLGAATEVQVSPQKDVKASKICESAEAAHGNRGVSASLASALGFSQEFIRLDGQCKYCVVGAGAAEGNVRLPPIGYIEKIWDHAPGAHFTKEAGGRVTDLQGRSLDFSLGRYLPASVQGVLSASAQLHPVFLQGLRTAYEAGIKSGEISARRYMDST